jgi:acetyl-CoA synthetase
MSNEAVYPVPEKWSGDAWIDADRYQELYRQSLDNPKEFWAQQSDQFLTWEKPWKTLNLADFSKAEASWFVGGKLNVTVNCIDRHLENHADQTAIIWEADDPGDHREISYAELHRQVSRFGNLLRELGVKKGDPVCIYMPMIPEAAYAMLACARIGAIHSVVFGGFSPEALKDRIQDCDCRVVITADEGIRGGKKIPLKQNADKAIENCPDVRHCVVVKRTGCIY